MARNILFLASIGLIVTTLVLKTKSALASDNSELEQSTIVKEMQLITPMSIELVESAMDVLSAGWSEMSPNEREVFLLLFDPSNSGQVDGAYVDQVLQNYRKIRATFGEELDFAYESDSSLCIGERLYYVDPLQIHVCPYFMVETITSRKARSLIHEVAHIALLALDRPYYGPESEQYAALKPNGNWFSRLPLVGPVFREVFREDTLFHPDAYAHFSLAMSGEPGAISLYLVDDAPVPDSVVSLGHNVEFGLENRDDQLAGSSWIRGH